MSPDWCGSVGWALSCKLKGRHFNSQSGHLPGLWARSPVGGLCARGNQLFLLHISESLPLCLPLFPSLKINKIFKNLKK